MGRPRLSLATSADVALTAAADSEAFRRLLAIDSAKRKPEETATLLKWYRRMDPEWQKLNQAVQDSAKQAPKPNTVKALVSGEGLPPVRLHTQGEDFLPATHFLRRGDCDQKDAVAPQGFLQVLMPAADGEKRWHRDAPSGSMSSLRGSSFAEWLTDLDAALADCWRA
jgi:hypothetical protein